MAGTAVVAVKRIRAVANLRLQPECELCFESVDPATEAYAL